MFLQQRPRLSILCWTLLMYRYYRYLLKIEVNSIFVKIKETPMVVGVPCLYFSEKIIGSRRIYVVGTCVRV